MSMPITVVGTGYLGTAHGVGMAELGHEVLGVDVDKDRIDALSEGRVPFYEPGLAEPLARHVAAGRLRFTTSYEEAAAFGKVHFLCVNTPQRPGGDSADLRNLHGAVDRLAPLLDRPALVVGKSTVPVGTAARLSARILDKAPAGADVELAWNPEFLREGHALADTLRPDRIVVGAETPNAVAVLSKVYAPLLDADVPMVCSGFATAELVKSAANAFLATKVSFINAMAELCEATGGDVTELARALGHDARIGDRYLRPGLGFGGGCLPKDLRAFRARARELGSGRSLAFLGEVDGINMRRRERMVELVREECGADLSGLRVAALGAAFKPDSDDVRDSPALHVAATLRAHGARVSVYDPRANANAARVFTGLRYADSVERAAAGADVVLLLTEWQEFRDLDPGPLAEVVSDRAVIDGRNALDPDRWRAAGWRYRALGRS
ncbi:UDP-glucose/GDP-mannose dehydrogenase family protein [Streptomyces sp. NPDC046939]|uniref:UDP-glucose dehydrogenase family protein n=1 Tax=Streptomyces sp. NPDC046939 TaxID=3155376 RepID=UPI0033CE4166